jgi:hypothetical protein
MIKERLTRAEDVIWRRVDDKIVVIKDDGLAIHVLNKTAAMIWEMYDGERSVDEIAQQLVERFEVPFDEACRDIEEIVEKLIKIGLMKQARGIDS